MRAPVTAAAELNHGWSTVDDELKRQPEKSRPCCDLRGTIDAHEGRPRGRRAIYTTHCREAGYTRRSRRRLCCERPCSSDCRGDAAGCPPRNRAHRAIELRLLDPGLRRVRSGTHLSEVSISRRPVAVDPIIPSFEFAPHRCIWRPEGTISSSPRGGDDASVTAFS